MFENVNEQDIQICNFTDDSEIMCNLNQPSKAVIKMRKDLSNPTDFKLDHLTVKQRDNLFIIV